jgi:GNAT superfamily N-acetyltransferase
VPRFSDPAPLDSEHRIDGFDCEVGSLNLWLVKHARAAAATGSARTYVLVDADQDRVVGYHALSVASIEHREATERVRKGMPQHPIPAMLLARLAVDKTVQGKGIGAFLLRDAMTRALAVADQAGMRLMLVHAVNDAARSFYERFGFEASPTDATNLQLIVKDIRRAVDESGR